MTIKLAPVRRRGNPTSKTALLILITAFAGTEARFHRAGTPMQKAWWSMEPGPKKIMKIFFGPFAPASMRLGYWSRWRLPVMPTRSRGGSCPGGTVGFSGGRHPQERPGPAGRTCRLNAGGFTQKKSKIFVDMPGKDRYDTTFREFGNLRENL